MIGTWLDKLLNSTTTIRRWQGKRTLIDKNDAEHMYGVAIIADTMARIQIEKFGDEINIAELLRCCLYHDTVEIETGDIPSDVKRKTGLMKKAVIDVEKSYYENGLKKLLPKNWRSEYEKYLLNPKQDCKTTIGKIVSLADNIDALNECIQEVKLGNETFKPFLPLIANSILDIDIQCAKYFLKYSLLDFGLSAQYYGDTISNFINTFDMDELIKKNEK